MKTINLTKFGFVRSKEEDFSDDGSRFTCYRVGDVRVSKSTYDDKIFIHGRYEGQQELEYEEFSKLPHYRAMDDLNGVCKSSLTDDDLIKFYEDCVAYDKEYRDALSKIVYPTIDEITNAGRSILTARKAELADVKQMLANSIDKLMHLSNYDLKSFKDSYNCLERTCTQTDTDIENYAKLNYGTLTSRNFVTDLDRALAPSYHYRECKSLLK